MNSPMHEEQRIELEKQTIERDEEIKMLKQSFLRVNKELDQAHQAIKDHLEIQESNNNQIEALQHKLMETSGGSTSSFALESANVELREEVKHYKILVRNQDHIHDISSIL